MPNLSLTKAISLKKVVSQYQLFVLARFEVPAARNAMEIFRSVAYVDELVAS